MRDPNEMLVRHILDSIVVAPYLRQRFIDGVTTGAAGHPAGYCSPLTRISPYRQLSKRVRFLRQVQHELKLENITPWFKVALKLHPSAEPPFDGVISRALSHR